MRPRRFRVDREGVAGPQRAVQSEDTWLRLSAIETPGDIGSDEAVIATGPLLSDGDMPRHPAGKLLKRLLRDKFEQDAGRII